MWQTYRSGFQTDSGIARFDIDDPESITVEHYGLNQYRFTNAKHGPEHIAKMKELALETLTKPLFT